MRILVLTPDYPPIANSASRLSKELVDDLRTAGHYVSVITRGSGGLSWLGRGTKRTKPSPSVIKIPPLPLPRRIPLARAADQAWQALFSGLRGFQLGRHDVVFAYSPPQPLTIAAAQLARRWGSPLVVNVQDVYPQTGTDLEILGGASLKASLWMEGLLYRQADAITVYSKRVKDYMVDRGGNEERLHVIPNWVEIGPGPPESLVTAWRRKHALADKFVVSFAGTMGFAQGLGDILACARLVADLKQVRFVLAGDGVMRRDLISEAKRLGLDNVAFLPFQNGGDYQSMLHASDVNLVCLDSRLATPVVPGKLQSLMAAGRPVLCVANADTGLGELISDSGCGRFVPAGSPQTIAESIRALLESQADSTEMGRLGREFAAKYFSRGSSTSRYEGLFETLTAR